MVRRINEASSNWRIRQGWKRVAEDRGFVNEVEGGQKCGVPRPEVKAGTGGLFRGENDWERGTMGREGLWFSGDGAIQVEKTV